jgi:hypothetical protein
MTYSRFTRAALLASLLVTSIGCGQDAFAPPPGPIGPTTLTPLLSAQVGGLWSGPLTLSNVGGGGAVTGNAGGLDCSARALSTGLGTSTQASLLLVQDGSDVTGSLTYTESGLSCAYKGTVTAQGNFVLEAEMGSCVQSIVLRCGDEFGGVSRELRLAGSSVSGSLAGLGSAATVQGVASHTYNVWQVTNNNQTTIGGIATTQQFSLVRR